MLTLLLGLHQLSSELSLDFYFIFWGTSMSNDYEFICGFRDGDTCFLKRPNTQFDLLRQMEKSHCDEKNCPIITNRRLSLRILELLKEA